MREQLAGEEYCYLTTVGRRTGRRHEIEIWFALDGGTLYMLSGGRDRSDWVRNINKTPAVRVRIAGTMLDGAARIVDPASDEDAKARRLLVEKYAPRYSGDLEEWRRTALPVAVDLAPAESG